MPIDQQILQRLQANDRTLIELGLTSEGLTAADMQELVMALQGNTTLIALDVRDNQIGDSGAEILAQNQTLTSLKVGGNLIGAEGAKALGLNQTLTSLDISDNHIGVAGAKAFGLNQTLTSLDIRYNEIGIIGAGVTQSIHLMLQANRRRAIERRNRFILHWLKWAKFQSLPLELVAHIISYVDSATFLALVSLRHFAQMEKSEKQAYQCALFILHNASLVKDQLALTAPSEPLIIERKPKPKETLSAQHFGFFKAPVANSPSDATVPLEDEPKAKRMRMME